MLPEKIRRILIGDDNRAIHDDFRKILAGPSPASRDLKDFEAELFGASSGELALPTYEIGSAFQGGEAVDMVRAALDQGLPYAIAFVDMRMPPGMDGVQTVAKLWEIDPELQVVICTAYSDYSWEDMLGNLGVNDRDEQTRDLEQANRRLEESESRCARAAAGANDGLWDWDLATNSVSYSARWKAMIGYAENEIGNLPLDWFEHIHSDDQGAVELAFRAHRLDEHAQVAIEYRIKHKDGHYRWMLARGLAATDAATDRLRIAGSHTDITDRKMAAAQLKHDAFHDTLTGLPNRALLIERIQRCLVRQARQPTFRFAVLFIDLDRFKVINDSLGHLVGDSLLVALARRLSSCVRDADTLSSCERSDLARLGGDEFVVLLEGIHQDADALRVADRLLESVSAPIPIDGQEVHASLSIGVDIGHPGYRCVEDHRRHHDGRKRHRHLRSARRARDQASPRRLRHGLFIAQLPQSDARSYPQDRPLFRVDDVQRESQ